MTAPLPTPGADRWRSAAPFAAAAALALLAAGVVAAATAYRPSYHASWATAYLVLVVGVAQLGLGLGQALLARRALPAATVALEFVAFNLGHLAVLAGALSDRHALTDLGGVLLLPALALMLWSVRSPGRDGKRAAYRAVVAVLLVSVPVGLVLARLGPA